MKLDFIKLLQTDLLKTKSYFLYGSQDSYLDFCVSQLQRQFQSIAGTVKVEHYNAAEFLDKSEVIQNQRDLFTPIAAKKIIIINDAKDRIVSKVKDFLTKAANDVYLVFPCLVASSVKQLKQLHEKDAAAAMVTCYLENGRNKRYYLNSLLAEHSLQLNNDAVTYALQRIEHDPSSLADDLYKLSLYRPDGGKLTVDDFQACCALSSEAQVLPLVFALGDRDRVATLDFYSQVKENGVEDVHLLRIVSSHFIKLLALKARVTAGENIQDALRTVRPFIFFQHYDIFKRHINTWTESKIIQTLSLLQKAELGIKTGHPSSALQVWRTILVITSLRAA